MKRLLVAVLAVALVSCATTTRFRVYDQASGAELKEYTIQIENRTLRHGESIRLSNAAWREYNAIVKADGYTLKQTNIAKELKPPPLVFGLITMTLVPLLWCYGPVRNQTFMLVKDE